MRNAPVVRMHHVGDDRILVPRVYRPVDGYRVRDRIGVVELMLPDQVEGLVFDGGKVVQAVIQRVRNVLDGSPDEAGEATADAPNLTQPKLQHRANGGAVSIPGSEQAGQGAHVG